MSMLSFAIFSRKLKLNKGFFSRNKWREKSDFFSHASYALTILGNVLVAVFFSPTVATATISVQDLLVMVTNVLVASGYLYEFVRRLYKAGLVLPIERFLTLTGIVLAIVIAVNLSPLVFTVALTPSTLLVCCSTLATAINSFFCVKNIIIPPLKRFLENNLGYWVFNKSEDSSEEITLNPDKDDSVIRILLDLKSSERVSDSHQVELDRFNKILLKLNAYKNKYNERFLGSVRHRQDIQDMEDGMTAIQVEGKFSKARDFLNTKRQRKAAKKWKLEDAIGVLDKAIDDLEQKSPGKDWSIYNETASKYFEGFESVANCEDMVKLLNDGRSIIKEEVERQQRKIAELEECLPPAIGNA